VVAVATAFKTVEGQRIEVRVGLTLLQDFAPLQVLAAAGAAELLAGAAPPLRSRSRLPPRRRHSLLEEAGANLMRCTNSGYPRV